MSIYIKIGEGECVMSKFAQMLHDQLSGERGGVVSLLLRSGIELAGVIVEVGEDFVVLKRKGSPATTIVLAEVVVFDFPDGTISTGVGEVVRILVVIVSLYLLVTFFYYYPFI